MPGQLARELVTKNLLRSNVVARKARAGGTGVDSLFWVHSDGLPRISRSGTGSKNNF